MNEIEMGDCESCGQMPELQQNSAGYFSYFCKTCDIGTHYRYSIDKAKKSWESIRKVSNKERIPMLTRPEAIRILYGTAVMGWDEAVKLMGKEYAGVTFKDVLYAMGVQEGEFHRAIRGDNEHNA